MKSLYKLLSITLLMAYSCTDGISTYELVQQNCTDRISISITVPDFVSSDSDTKLTISTKGELAWSAGDKIGLFSNHIDNVTQTTSQLALTLSSGEGESATYSSSTGWALVPGSAFNYFSYYPYSETNSREKITIDYIGQTQTANNSTVGLGAYDYMYSDMAAATSSSSASFSFHHIGCPINVNITVPAEYENTTFYQMRLYADTEAFTSSASYSVNDIVTYGTPEFVKQTSNCISLSFGDAGITPTDGIINAWLMMCPTQWKEKTITAKLYASKSNVPTLLGTFTPDVNQTSGIIYSYPVTAAVTGQILPEKPIAGEQLHILLFGHSFGLDCTEYLPGITLAAGITNVHYGRWFQGNCSLLQHWNHVTKKDTYLYYDSRPSDGSWKELTTRKVDDVLLQYPWDIILFQQSIGFEGEGDYKSYQPYLNNLTEYVTDYCETAHGKTPIIGWNMFWGYNSEAYNDGKGSLQYAAYDIDATDMYHAIVKATQDMINDKEKNNDIPLIVPAGTALQNARCTSLNDPGSAESPSTTYLLTRDGYHTTCGIGRYVTACTWFQYLIAPIYGTAISGNSFRKCAYSFQNDQVTDERAAICWQCAIEAVNHPYEVMGTTDKTGVSISNYDENERE